MSWLIVIAIVTVISVTRGDHPLWISEIEEIDFPIQYSSRNSEAIYRLPKSVIPLDYDIYIDFFFSESPDRPFSYDGKETINLQVVEENVTSVILHSNIDKINDVLVTKNGVSVTNNGFSLEPQYHFLIVHFPQPLEVNQIYTLFIDYTSTMNDGPMKRGIWRGWYKDDNGNERIYATTHFQPYNARQAFPCFDEPLFKATFKIHLSMPMSYVGTFSNTEVQTREILNSNRIRYNFYESPKMSTYLVTFLVSETFTVVAIDKSYTPAIRIIGRSNIVGLGDHALELTVKMTKHFNEYFKIPYSSLHPYLLNDHISSPDWASAATENWGMVSYRELYLVIDPRETIMSVEHYAATLVSHELAHKWFGNLITCYWWSNTWINEGFASYFGYIAAHEMFPQYDLHEHFNSRYLQTSLAFDSGVSTVPLNYDVNTPAQVTGHFGTISYSKGAAILRMLSDMITPTTFQKACQYFLINNPYKAIDQYDLYNAFALAIEEDQSLKEYLNFNFTDYYRIWVNEPGYPILLVNVDQNEIRLKQERFSLSSSVNPAGLVYPIPITYTTKTSMDFSNLKPIYMMTSDQAVLMKDAREEWVIFNIKQHGHYRVHYDEKTWNLISEALLENKDSIHYLNRAQIVDDVFALMRSARMSYNFGFKILRFLRYEDNYHVWTTAVSGYTWLRNRLRHFPESQIVFDSYIISYMSHVMDKLGSEPAPNETITVTLTRQEVFHFACNLGLEQCLQDSRSKFLSMRVSGTWVDPRIRRHVYIAGIRGGGQEDFDFLLNRFKTSNFANDQLEMLRGLASTKDPQLLRRYLEMTLEKEVRSHDKANSFNYALLGNKENAAVVLEFVKSNIDEIRKAYVEDSPPTPVHTALVNLASYLNETELNNYEDWLRNKQSDSAQFTRAIAAINSARSVITWGETNADMILAAARGGASVIVLSTLLLSAMYLVTVFA